MTHSLLALEDLLHFSFSQNRCCCWDFSLHGNSTQHEILGLLVFIFECLLTFKPTKMLFDVLVYLFHLIM